MAITFGFFSDPALTTPISTKLSFVQDVSSPSSSDLSIYFGSPNSAKSCQAESDPGVDPVQVTIVDSTPASGSPASDVKLALSYSGLSSATGGAALDLPETINGGATGAIQIFIRVLDSTHTSGVNTDISLVTNSLMEYLA